MDSEGVVTIPVCSLESEGAEFLVLGQLLIQGIPAYKTYTNMPGYDLVATNPERHRTARIKIESRWKTKAEGFITNNCRSYAPQSVGQATRTTVWRP